MYLELPFKRRRTRSVKVILNLGVLENICTEAKIEFHELREYISSHGGTFAKQLLYYGYLAGCIADRKKPKYTEEHADYWVIKILPSEQAKLFIMIEQLYGKADKVGGKPEGKKKAK